ncbi:ATP-binding cassette domain-containing protein [Aureimonas leprariae]|uniref:ATP-binding cassette domain-containing protein n=1 Tax=Plantimonas leprariae TaxID=2615207 RepID=A0A7V7TW12_9HYPH|nr:ATP-binding cassette domain-containing protein [Aureimonas leprariae]KAB0679236.1 ATP-binding cassette domain-containing protein [Aureimonas leprariae]
MPTDDAPPPALVLDAVAHRYGADRMLFDLAVAPGEWLAVIGPSGAGKSTMLDLAAGFLGADGGRVLIAGRDVTRAPPAARPLTCVFQDNNLFPHLDVFANVALGIAPDLKLDAAQRRRVGEALERVGLGGFERRRPAAMSGGERQRVALARAALRDRPLLLLDEPFAALGPALRREMLDLLAGLRDGARGAPPAILMVTHHPEDARGRAARTAFVADGRVAALGATETLLAMRDGPVAEYLGR